MTAVSISGSGFEGGDNCNVITRDRSGNVYVALYKTSDKTIRIYQSTDDGATWSDIKTISNGGIGSKKGFCINNDCEGCIYFAYNYWTGSAHKVRYDVYNGTSWSTNANEISLTSAPGDGGISINKNSDGDIYITCLDSSTWHLYKQTGGIGAFSSVSNWNAAAITASGVDTVLGANDDLYIVTLKRIAIGKNAIQHRVWDGASMTIDSDIIDGVTEWASDNLPPFSLCTNVDRSFVNMCYFGTSSGDIFWITRSGGSWSAAVAITLNLRHRPGMATLDDDSNIIVYGNTATDTVIYGKTRSATTTSPEFTVDTGLPNNQYMVTYLEMSDCMYAGDLIGVVFNGISVDNPYFIKNGSYQTMFDSPPPRAASNLLLLTN